jgi:hypothetical protein
VGRRKRKGKRLSIVREPSGRLSRAGERREFAPALVKRLRDKALRDVSDHRWGTELGRLFLEQKIDGPLFAAGERWRKLAAAYYAAIGAPQPTPRPLSMERGSHSAQPDPESAAGVIRLDAERRVIALMDRAHSVLVGAGKIAESVVRAVCERDENAAAFDLVYLTNGLTALALHWRLIADVHHGRLPG